MSTRARKNDDVSGEETVSPRDLKVNIPQEEVKTPPAKAEPTTL
jgi:hypothetical protein